MSCCNCFAGLAKGKGGLPSKIKPSNIEVVAKTTSTVAPRALDITKTFYKDILNDKPQLFALFNSAHNVPKSTHQPEALAAAICAYASNIKDLKPLLTPGGPVDAICHRHCALGILPEHYPLVHEYLMAAIGKELGSGVKDGYIGDAWSEAVLYLAKVMIDKEQALYTMAERREGGWRGYKDFFISKVERVAADTKKFTFKPVHGSAKFDFTPGQYLSLKVTKLSNAPRHYTVTSNPGDDFLECTIKKIPGGEVSTYLHDQAECSEEGGEEVQLAAPFGVFTPDMDNWSSQGAVLISAGIGVTPMLPFARALKDTVRLVVHVDKSPQAYPYREKFERLEHLAKYTSQGGRPNSAALSQEIIDKAGVNNTFYICGPEKWMQEMNESLLALSAKKVMCEVFGSQLATKCPFATAK